MKAAKLLLTFGGAYLVWLAIPFVLMILTAGVTSHWSASKAGNAMLVLLAGVVFLMLLCDFIFWKVLPRIELQGGARVLATLGLFLVQGVTAVMFAFVTAVIFNR